jgi:hypothetical protein
LVVLTGVGLARMLTWWLRTRAMVLLAAARGEEVPVQVNIHRWELVDEAELAEEAARARAARRAEHEQDDPMDVTQGSITGGTR